MARITYLTAIDFGAVENFGHVHAAGQWILSFCMRLGRRELFTVLVLFSPGLGKR